MNLQFVLDLALFAAVIGVMILAHELGHFLVARAWKIRIDEFGIGFPPRLATLFTSRGTRFTLNWIPLGGFVRPAGEDDPSVPDGLAAASRLARATVLLAGPFANFLLAFVAFTSAFKFASPDLTQVLLTSISQGSPAEAAGLQAGDIVMEVDGHTVTGIEVLRQAIADSLGEPAQLTVRRGTATLSLSILPRAEPPPGEGPIGVTLGHPARQVPWAEAVSLGVRSVGEHLMQVLRLPGMWLRGELSPDEARITGLKGMYDMLTWAGEVDRASQRPFVTLTFLGFMSASLGLANLLPIPALDGGRLLFVGFEAVFGKRVAPRYEGLAHAVGFAILLALMVYVNFQDFLNPVPFPLESPMEESFEAVLNDLGALALPDSQDRLYALSDLDHAQTVRLQADWPTFSPSQRLLILESLGDLARDHVELNFDQVDRMALPDRHPGVRRQAILNLWESEDPDLARPFLAALTGDSAAEVRSAAARALGLFVYLGELGRIPESLRRSVEDALLRSSHADGDENVRLHSIESLGYSSREEVSTLIREAYATGREGLQRSALVAMGRSANEIWSPSVTAQLTSPSPDLRLESARAAGELEIRSAVPGLLELLEDVNTEVRQAAAWSLGQLGGPQAVRALTRLLEAAEEPGEVRQLTDALDHLAFVEGTRRIGMLDLDED